MIPIIRKGSDHPYPPVITEVTKPFWDSLAEGRFLAVAGPDGALTFPPRNFDRESLSRDTTLVELSGKGTLYSITEVHAAPAVFVEQSPYCVCIVDLEEGIRLATTFIGPVTTPLDSAVELVTIQYENAVTYAARPQST